MKYIHFQKPYKLLTAILGLLFVFIWSFYFLIVPKFINIEECRLSIIKEINKSLKLPFAIGKPNVSMTWNLGIKIHSKNIILKHKDKTNYITTGPIDVEISLPYFFQQQIRIRNINVQNPELVLHRLPNGKLDIEELISSKPKNYTAYKTILQGTTINLSNYNISFIDKFVFPCTKYQVSGKRFKISGFTPKKFIRIDANGEIFSEKRPSTVFDISCCSELPINTKDIFKNNSLFNGKIRNFYPDMYLNYLNVYTPEYSAFSGVGNMNFIFNLAKEESKPDKLVFKSNIRDFSLQKVRGKREINFPGLTNIVVCAQQRFEKCRIKEITIKNKQLNAKINGCISKIASNDPEMNLNVNLKNSKIEPISDFLSQKLRKYKIKGLVSTDINIRGAYKDAKVFW